jgi:hypothetical protein
MPHLIGVALTGLGLYAGVKLLQGALRRLDSTVDHARARAKHANGPQLSERDLGALVWDEKAQVYRPQHEQPST